VKGIALSGLIAGLCAAGSMVAADGAAGPAGKDPMDPTARKGAADAPDPSTLFAPDAPDLIGKAAPAFTLPRSSGEPMSLEALKGKVVVLNFWASWCKPCVEELPSLERLRRQLKGAPVEIVGVSVDESWEPVKKLTQQRPVQFNILLDTSKSVPERYGTSRFPETFILDREGRVKRKLIGAQIWDRGDFVTYLKQLAKE
jgi:peroxiredoxin